MAPATADSAGAGKRKQSVVATQWLRQTAQLPKGSRNRLGKRHGSRTSRKFATHRAERSLLLNAWRRRALVVGAIFAVLSIVLALLAATVDHDGINHLLRSYLLGYIMVWGSPWAAWRC